jgi:sugar lactone lactonase YvrE
VGCRGEVWRIAPEALRASGPVTAAATLRVDSPAGLAFDAAGNLWVASRRSGSMPRSLTRFDASRLGTGAEPAASLTIANGSGLPGVPAGLTATWLAFDRDGTLWVVDATAGAVARLPASALAATGEATVTADTVIFLGVLGLPEKPHLDESGGLWLAGSMGRLARLGRDQLDTSSSPGAPTTPERVLVLGDVSYAGNVAGYPAPAGLPLVSSLP